jgi:L-seryl-tRNA(Ser) seleniumtransferase
MATTTAASAPTIYDELGVTPVINARGNYTTLGGSSFSPAVRRAMEEADRYFVDMQALQDRAGQTIAELLGAEAALVTPGAAAALALGTAACITGLDGTKMERLPDTAGMKRDVVIQRGHRYHYDHCVTIVGARLVEVGDDAGTALEQLAAALGPDTAAILFPAHLDGEAGTVPLAEVIRLARERAVPTLVDAAGQVFPLERMKGYAAQGCDLVCFGSKYFGGPNSAGILCGRRELVAAAATQSFVGYETSGHRTFGRPLKLDRQEIVAVVVALREWLTMDHEARLRRDADMASAIARHLEGIPHVTAGMQTESGPAQWVDRAARLRVEVDQRGGRTAAQVAEALARGNPSILLHVEGDALVLAVATLWDGDEEVVGRRLREELTR